MSSSEDDVRQRIRQRLQNAEPDVRDRIRERLGQGTSEPTDGTTALGTFVHRLLGRTGDALGATPSATGDLLAMGAAGAEGTVRGLVPGGEGFEYGRRYREQQEQFPASALRAIPRVRTDQVDAGREAVFAAVPGGESPGEAYGRSMEESQQLRRQQESEHPIASMAGDLGGSVAALLLTKRPLQGAIRRTEQKLMNPAVVSEGVEEAPSLARDINRALSSNAARLPARGTMRGAETGLEAAYLEAINEAENDPMLAAGLAAGGQVASSNLWGGLKKFAKGGLGQAAANFTASAIATGGIWQMLKSATPGGRDRILESLEGGFDKTTYAVMLGTLGSAMGARGRNQITDDLSQPLREIIEGFTTTNRTGVLSVLTEMVDAPKEERQVFEDVLDRTMADPDFEGNNEQEREMVERLRDRLQPEQQGPVRGEIQRGSTSSSNGGASE